MGYLERMDRKYKKSKVVDKQNKTVFCGHQNLWTYKLTSIVIACIDLRKNKSVRILESRAEMMRIIHC